MKSQASPFSFGCLFHWMPFYHRTKTTFSGRKLRETARSKQNSPQSHTHHILRGEDPKRIWTLQKLPDITPHHLKPNVFCWGCLAKKNNTKKNPSETDFPKNHICFQLPMLVQQHSWVPKTHRPLTPSPDRCCSASTSHSQNHFLCKTSSLRRKNALIV